MHELDSRSAHDLLVAVALLGTLLFFKLTVFNFFISTFWLGGLEAQEN